MILTKIPPIGCDERILGLNPIVLKNAGLQALYVVSHKKLIGCFHIQFQSEITAQVHIAFLPNISGKIIKKACTKLEELLIKTNIKTCLLIFPEFPICIKGVIWMIQGHIIGQIPAFFIKDGVKIDGIVAFKTINMV